MAKQIRKPPDDEGVFTAQEVDVRAVIVRWDALERRPVMHLGGVTPHEAFAWLQAAANECWAQVEHAECGVEEDD